MKTTVQKTKNPFATFSLRGGCLRKSGKGVASYAPFLMATASAVVLGSMFALSMPSVANAGYECGEGVSGPDVSTTTHFTSAVRFSRYDSDPATERGVTVTDTDSDPNTSTTVVTDTHRTIFQTSAVPVSGVYRGVYFYRSGNGDICLSSGADMSNVSYGIQANRDGEGIIDIQNTGSITNAEYDGIYVVRSGEGDIKITSQGAISSERGVYAWHEGEGDIEIRQFSQIDTGGNGIEAEHIGEGNVEITLSTAFDSSVPASITTGGGDGIDVEHADEGDVEITLSGGTSIVTGSDGTLTGDGVKVRHEDNGIVDIDISSGGSIRSNNHGIFVEHEGTYATNTSNNTYSVHVDIDGEVAGHKKGVLVEHRGTGDVVVEVDSAGSVTSRWYEGIKVNHAGTGKIKVDVSGAVSGGNDSGPITMMGSNDKTLVLRPGFSLSGEVASKGSGKGFLELAGRKPGSTSTSTSTSNTLGLGNIKDFKEFVKADETAWTVTGTSLSRFERAGVTGGTLRFSNVTFSMASNTREFFRVRDGGVLEVTGTNTLEGDLNNTASGKIDFLADRDSTLNVTGNYKGRGKVIFDVGADATAWKNHKLSINGILSGANLGRVVEVNPSTGAALGATNSDWLIESGGADKKGYFKATTVSTDENAESGATEQNIGGNIYDFVHEYDSVNSKNKWMFRWREVAPTVLSDAPRRIPPPRREPEGPEVEPPEGTAFRADARGHEGGLWAEQRSSRALLKSSTGGLLRKEGDSVHFGFDLPVRSFMGGDVVLGAGVLQEVSVSDISSSAVDGAIGTESHSASLRASWWSPVGFYVDGQSWYTRFSNDISMEGRSLIQDNEGVGMGATADLGYRFAVPLGGMDFEVVPQMQLVWSSVGFDDFVGSRGERVSLEDGDLVTGRLGLSWDGEWDAVGGSGRVYGGMNLRGALDGRTSVNISGVSLVSKDDDLSVDGSIGVSYEWDDGYSVYGEAKAFRHGNVEEVRANLGMSIDF